MILVDTQAVLWLTEEDSRLSEAAELLLIQGRKDGTLAIADITLREIAMLVSKGRVTLPMPLSVYLEFLESIFRVMPISARIAERSIGFGKKYPNDPADKLIGATAIIHGMVLVTKDQEIRASGEVNCVW